MNLERLFELNRAIGVAIESLPPVDPMTIPSRDETRASEDYRIRAVLARVCAGETCEITKRIDDEFFNAGPIEALMSDEGITEIITNGPDSIWFEKNGRLRQCADRFLSDLNYRNFILRLSREAGIQVGLDCPFADGRWRGCRVHLIIPPASGHAAVVTLRRHSAHPWSLARLSENEWADTAGLEKLRELVETRKNFLIVGGTGSGKTTVLGACLALLSEDERVLTIEDTDELPRANSVSTKLLTRRDANGVLREIDQGELLKQALRMRPDRIVMGEIRGGEAKDLLMAFATGHAGCIGTLHADSARQALLRLEMLIQIGAPQWSLHAVRALIWLSIQTIVVVGRRPCGARRLEGVYRIASLEDVGFLIEKLS